MENISKAWDWKEVKDKIWYEPSEESYYLLKRWQNFNTFLDLGCGLGRHSVLFAENNFETYALDLSEYAVEELKTYSHKNNLGINCTVSDMVNLPYEDNFFDCIFSYHVISHTDTAGAYRIISEIKRVLKPGGEIYFTLCSKQTWSYTTAKFPKIDENTVLKTEEGPEKNIPHFFADKELIKDLLKDFSILSLSQKEDLIIKGKELDSWHYFILASLK
ncbi:MAG: class I SAM-dependent methyltransferase [Thermotogae bacterium]|nr:class I SAM-dependent methyltransferase [Thermotogota bacterium]